MSVLSLEQACVDLDERPILRDIDLHVSAGEFVVLVGPNGAGKSTALRAALGLVPLISGKACVDDKPLTSLGAQARGRLLSYLPQQRELAWRLRTCDLVALGRFAYGGAPYERLAAQERAIIDEALARMDMTALAQRSVATLSGGEQARAHLARALATHAPILVADEPTTALDPRHQIDALATLRAEADGGVAVVAALHDLDAAARWADRIVVIDSGRVLIDEHPGSALSNEMLMRVFRVRRGEFHRFEAI